MSRTVAEVFSSSAGRCHGYDVRGQQTQSTLSVSFGTNATISQTVQMAYNDGGEVTQLTYPDGQVLTSVYDNNGRVRSAYFGTPSSTDPVTFLAGQVTYTNAGQIAGMAIGGSGAKASMPTPVFTTATIYDAIQRPQSSSATEAGQTIWSQTRTYDSVGNVLGLSTVVPTQGGGTATENEGFCYDALNRLVWAGNSGTPTGGDHCMAPPTGTTLPTSSQAYSYDTLDRMTSGAAGTETYGDPTHVHAVTGLSSLANPYAAYDAMGNMTCRNSDPSSAHTCDGASPTGALMTYDAQGQLVSWTAPNGTTASDQFLSDGEGNRVLQRATTGSAVTSTVSFDGYTETVRKGGKNTTTTYYNLNGQRVALRVGTGTLDYLLSDPLGSNTAALNSTGQVIALQHYSPYGTVDSSWGTMPTSYGYASQRADSQTGLLYDNFRYYDPLSGRFVRSDDVQDNSKGMDPYAYVGDNPETRNDPTGHCWPVCLFTALAGVVVGATVGLVHEYQTGDWSMGAIAHTVADAGLGAADGFLIGTGLGAEAGAAGMAALVGTAIGGTVGAVAQVADPKHNDFQSTFESAAFGGISNAAASWAGGLLKPLAAQAAGSFGRFLARLLLQGGVQAVTAATANAAQQGLGTLADPSNFTSWSWGSFAFSTLGAGATGIFAQGAGDIFAGINRVPANAGTGIGSRGAALLRKLAFMQDLQNGITYASQTVGQLGYSSANANDNSSAYVGSHGRMEVM